MNNTIELFGDLTSVVPTPQTLGSLEFSVLESTLATSKGMLDIGANVGIFSLLAAQNLQFEGPIYAVEPEANNFQILQRNINYYNTHNIEPLQIAMGPMIAEGILLEDAQHNGNHSLLSGVQRQPGQPVFIETVDHVLSTRPLVDFIKMDVQGYEGLVLKGMTEWLKHPSVLMMEYDPLMIADSEVWPQQILLDLMNAGYQVFDLSEIYQAPIPITQQNFHSMTCDHAHRQTTTNLVCIKS